MRRTDIVLAVFPLSKGRKLCGLGSFLFQTRTLSPVPVYSPEFHKAYRFWPPKCCYCGREIDHFRIVHDTRNLYGKYRYTLRAYSKSGKQFNLDHIIPVSLGGSDEISNVRPSCVECNTRKGMKLPNHPLVIKALKKLSNKEFKKLLKVAKEKGIEIPEELEQKI